MVKNLAIHAVLRGPHSIASTMPSAGTMRKSQSNKVSYGDRLIYRELSDDDLDQLNANSHLLGVNFGGYYTPGERRYIHYRRRGYCPADALSYSLAWCRNAAEQYDRRLSHETGAEGWREIGA